MAFRAAICEGRCQPVDARDGIQAGREAERRGPTVASVTQASIDVRLPDNIRQDADPKIVNAHSGLHSTAATKHAKSSSARAKFERGKPAASPPSHGCPNSWRQGP